MKFFEGICIFISGIIIAYVISLLTINSPENTVAGFIAALIVVVCYLAGVVWVASKNIIGAIEKSNSKDDRK